MCGLENKSNPFLLFCIDKNFFFCTCFYCSVLRKKNKERERKRTHFFYRHRGDCTLLLLFFFFEKKLVCNSVATLECAPLHFVLLSLRQGSLYKKGAGKENNVRENNFTHNPLITKSSLMMLAGLCSVHLVFFSQSLPYSTEKEKRES